MAKKCYAYHTELKKKVEVPCKKRKPKASDVPLGSGGAGKAASAIKKRTKQMQDYMKGL